MNFRRTTLALVCLAVSSVAASGQFAVYGKFDYLHLSDPNSTTHSFAGGGVGVYDDFLRIGPVRVGIDARGDLISSSNRRYRDLLVGPRVAFKTPILPLKPYAQFSVGVGGSRTTATTAPGIIAVYDNKLLYEFFGGLDVTVLPHLDVRAIEIGYGRNHGYGTPTLVTVSTGAVLRF